MKHLIGLLLIVLSLNAVGQPPLSKRDQKKKAAFEAQIAAEETYAKLMATADSAFKAKDYVKARMTYNEAKDYNAEKEQWLISKVNDLDILMAKRAAREIDSITVIIPAKEITTLSQPEVTPEIETRKVEADRPEVVGVEEEPETVQVEEVPKEAPPTENTGIVVAKDVQMSPKKPTPKPALQETKPTEKKVKESFEEFPSGITEQTFDLKNQSVLRIVVKDGMEVKVFKRVKHNWGGEFYFLDDISVTQRYWQEEVMRYREKFGEQSSEK